MSDRNPARPLARSLDRRSFIRMAGASAGAAALAACSNGGPATSGGPATLSYRIWSASQLDAMRALVDAFRAQHNDLNVEVEVTPDDQYWTKMEAAATSGTLPDVFWMHARQFVLYAQNEAIRPIDDLIERAGVDLAQYPSVLVEAYKYEGRQYALPRNFNLIGLWYNRALLEAAGVPHPDDTWSWQDLEDAAAELTDKKRGRYGFAAPLQGQTGYWNAVYQNNGLIISDDLTRSGYDDPATRQAIDWWTGFLRTGSSPSHQQLTETAPAALFQSGKLAMMFEGDWNASSFAADPALAEQVDVAVLPQGARRACIMHGSGNVVAATTKNPDQAAALVEFLASKTAQDIQSKMGASGPPSVTGSIDAWIATNPAFSLDVFKRQVDDAVLFPHSRDTTAWQELETRYLTPLWAGETDVEAATAELAAAMNAVLAREQG